MLTKAIILNRLLDNHYLVRIPILENPNDSEISKVEATLSHTPGIVEAFKKDDVVIVGFEDHSPYKPIILGKLFVDEDENEPRGYAQVESLEVKESASLPNDLTIGGRDFQNVSQMFDNLQDLQDSSIEDVVTNVDGHLYYGGSSSNDEIATIGNIQLALTPNLVSAPATTQLLMDVDDSNYYGAQFTIGSDYNGLYIFTYANCMILLSCYNMTDNTKYKTCACLMDQDGSYSNKILTYKKLENTLYIYNKENIIPSGYTAYLFRVKLY